MKNLLMSFGAQAQIGKDYAVDRLKEYFGDNNVARVAFADPLKQDLDQFLIEAVGISAFTAKPEEKLLIRPMLVAYGEMMRKTDINYWVKRGIADAEEARKTHAITVITDARYPNEVDAVKEAGGVSFFIETDKRPANQSEADNAPICREKADVIIRNNFTAAFAKDLLRQVKLIGTVNAGGKFVHH